MKIGAFFMVLLLALVLLGFLINDSFYTHSELATANETIVSIQTEADQIKEQMAQQTKELQGLSAKNDSLQLQNKELQNRNSTLELQAQSLADEITRLQTENASLQQIATQSSPETTSPFDQAITRVTSPNDPASQSMALGLFIPMLLAGSGVVVYGLYHYDHKRIHPGGYMVRVSKHELDLLIRHRRAS